MPTSAWSRLRACRQSSAGPNRGPAASLPRRMTSCRSTSTRIRPPNVVLRRFYYPLWRLDPPLPVMATDPLQLVAFPRHPATTPFACSA